MNHVFTRTIEAQFFGGGPLDGKDFAITTTPPPLYVVRDGGKNHAYRLSRVMTMADRQTRLAINRYGESRAENG